MAIAGAEHGDVDMQMTEIEMRADVLAGEPVIKGTRVAARHVAELVERGEALDAIADDLDLSLEQIEAAVAFVKEGPQATPRIMSSTTGKREVPAVG